MIQRGDRTRFTLEPLAEFFAGNLDRDIPPQSGIPSAVHFAHASRTNGREKLIWTQPCTRSQGHGAVRLIFRLSFERALRFQVNRVLRPVVKDYRPPPA